MFVVQDPKLAELVKELREAVGTGRMSLADAKEAVMRAIRRAMERGSQVQVAPEA